MNPCLGPGCTSAGVFPGAKDTPDGPVEGYWCFGCDPAGLDLGAGTTTAERAPEPVPDNLFHVDVVSGLTAMVLEHVAMTAVEGDDSTDQAMRSLAANTNMSLDLAAGILLAVSAVAAAGDVTPEQLTDLAALYEAEAERVDDETTTPAEVGPDDDRDTMPDEETCPQCDGTGRTEDAHHNDPADDCPFCDGRGVVDIVGPAGSSTVEDDGDVLPASDMPGEPTTESET